MARRSEHPPIFNKREKRHYVRNFFIWLFIAIFLVALVVFVINYGTNAQVVLKKESITVWNLPKDLEGFTILHISDLHAARFRDNQSAFKDTISEANYKAVVMTGDMVGTSGDYKPFLEMIQVIRALKPEVPIYFISGDNDPDPVLATAHANASPLNDYVTMAQALGAIYVDAPTALTVNKAIIWFNPESQYNLDLASQLRAYTSQRDAYITMGQRDTPDGAAGIRALEYRIVVMNRLSIARKQMQDTDLQIVLSHEPLTEAYFREMAGFQADDTAMDLKNATLALAGHYNGGQWRSPINGQALYIPDLGFFPNPLSYVGISRIGGLTQHISEGLGSSALYPFEPGRLFNPPTVTIITLTSKVR